MKLMTAVNLLLNAAFTPFLKEEERTFSWLWAGGAEEGTEGETKERSPDSEKR